MLNQLKGVELVKKSKIDENGKHISADFDYNGYRLAATACTKIGTTITLPSNYAKCDYIFVVKNIDDDKTRETFFLKMDDIAEKIQPTEFENANPYILKKMNKNLKLQLTDIKKRKTSKATTSKKYSSIF